MPDVEKPVCCDCKCAKQGDVDRRGVLARLLSLVGGFLGLGLLGGCPGGSTFGRVTEKTGTGNVPPELSRLEWEKISLPDGIAGEFKVNGKPAYLLQTVLHKKITITAVLRRCPHSGCTVNYIYTKQKLECPCHGSTFDAEGVVIKGPAKKGLTRLDVREEAGKVIVEVPGAYVGKHGVIKSF